jgi:adenylate cyclase
MRSERRRFFSQGWHKYKQLLQFSVLALVLLSFSSLSEFQMLESRSFDLISTFAVSFPEDSPVVLVGIDEASFAEIGSQWPWPRALHGQLIDSLKRAGAAVIAMDIIFAEHSEPGSDEKLSQAISAAGSVVLAGDLVLEENRHISQLIRIEPLDQFQEAGAGTGIAAVTLDGDGIIRKLPTYDDGFALRTLHAWEKLHGKGLSRPPASGALIQFFGPSGSYPSVSYYQALQPETFLPPDIFRDRIVIVGRALKSSPDPGARQADSFFTPFSQFSGTSVAGMEVHATILDTLRLGVAIQPVSATLRHLLLLVVLALSFVLFRDWHPRSSSMTALVLMTGIVAGSVLLLRKEQIWLPPLMPLLAVVLGYGVQAGSNFLKVYLERSRIKHAFGRYLSPGLVEQLAADPSRLQLGGEKRCLSIMFCDVRGFTTISERFSDDPEGLTRVMNRFFTAMTEVILDSGGTVDKYIGDCIMAFWNAPLDDTDHASHACQAALAMGIALEKLNAEFAEEMRAAGMEPLCLNIGIGINSGLCLVGNLGSLQRFDYSVLGDAVNLASRLEGQTKNYGIPIVVGPQTARDAEGVVLLELDKIVVKGKREAVQIFGVQSQECFSDGDAARAFEAQHAAFIRAYRSRSWREGLALLEAGRREQRALSGLYHMYEERILSFEQQPPADGWDGVVVATSK